MNVNAGLTGLLSGGSGSSTVQNNSVAGYSYSYAYLEEKKYILDQEIVSKMK
jgi:hypothetical protein